MLHKLLFWCLQTLWIERTTMETSRRFPGVLSFYPVARAEAVSRRDRECGREEGRGWERGRAGGMGERDVQGVGERRG